VVREGRIKQPQELAKAINAVQRAPRSCHAPKCIRNRINSAHASAV
jgi:hypothetical protein